MPDRFFCPKFPVGDTAQLEGGEARHAARVLRKSPGDVIEIFDGAGQAAAAEIARVSKKSVELTIRERQTSPPPSRRVVLATAVPKGDRFRWLVEKAVELGVDRLIPLRTARSVVAPGEGKRDKMQQAVIEACKQSGRNWLMTLEEPMSFETFLADEIAGRAGQTRLLAHPQRSPLSALSASEASGGFVLITGPEGGFTEEEVQQAEAAGSCVVGLGPNILRIETAAVFLASYAALCQRANECGDDSGPH